MRQRIINTVLFIFFTSVIFGQGEQEVFSQVSRLNKAIFGDKDSAILDKILFKRVSYGHSSGKVENRKEMISGAMSSNTTYRDFRMENFSVFFERKKLAIVRHDLKAIAVDNGKESLLGLRVLQVWIKRNNQWKLLARQSVRI